LEHARGAAEERAIACDMEGEDRRADHKHKIMRGQSARNRLRRRWQEAGEQMVVFRKTTRLAKGAAQTGAPICSARPTIASPAPSESTSAPATKDRPLSRHQRRGTFRPAQEVGRDVAVARA